MKQVLRDTRGSVAIIFGLTLVPIVLLMGAAVDYSYANMIKRKLDAVADTSALFAVNKSAMSLSASVAKANAETFFGTQSKLARANVKSVKIDVSDTKTGRTAVVTYTANVTTSFMGLVGMNTVTVGGSATAASGLPTYMDFYLLLDNTPAMGVGATTSDITKLINNRPINAPSPATISHRHPTTTTTSQKKSACRFGSTSCGRRRSS